MLSHEISMYGSVKSCAKSCFREDLPVNLDIGEGLSLG
jgi:hypothetical protein